MCYAKEVARVGRRGKWKVMDAVGWQVPFASDLTEAQRRFIEAPVRRRGYQPGQRSQSGGIRTTSYTARPITVSRADIVAETKYDGLTGAACLIVLEDNQRHDYRTLHGLTPAQLAAARELWSLKLRAKLAESRERERNAVVMPIDAEDIPWR